jgi:hypothetical protein
MRVFSKGLFGFSILIFCSLLAAQEPSDSGEPSDWDVVAWNLQTSLYTYHFDPDPDHVNNQKLISLEAIFANDWLAGLAVFDNSFGQNSQFLYVGKTWAISKSGLWYFKLTGGLLHGYKEPYEDKIPLNGLGIAPAIVPTLGFRYKRVLVEAQLAGTAAMMITAGVRFGQH